MRTREESLNNFCRAVDGLMESKYLFANSGVYDVITVINSSKLLSDLFKYFTEDFNFYETYARCCVNENGVKSFNLPARNTDVIAFVYCLLREINYSRFQLSDMLEYFGVDKNYEACYMSFCKTVLAPFRSYTYQIGMQIINSVQFPGEGEEVEEIVPVVVEKPQPVVEPVNVVNEVEELNAVSSNEEVAIQSEANAVYHVQPINKVTFSRTIYRLLDLDKLAITQSHTSRDDKEELIYVLELFNKKLLEGDAEKICLAYYAYYFALRPYKKIKSNIREITDILLEMKILG